VPGSAEARVAVKAARFRPRLKRPGLCSSAPAVSFGQLLTAPLFRLGLETGIEAAVGAGSQSKGHTMTKETNKTRPTHRVYAVTENGEKKFWQPIGAMWAHADANGFNLRIDYLPLNDATIVVRVAGDKQVEGGAQ